jgi:hypothetical protein
MRIAFPLNIRLNSLLGKRPRTNLQLLYIVEVRKIHVTSFQEFISVSGQLILIIQHFNHISEIKRRIKSYPGKIFIFNESTSFKKLSKNFMINSYFSMFLKVQAGFFEHLYRTLNVRVEVLIKFHIKLPSRNRLRSATFAICDCDSYLYQFKFIYIFTNPFVSWFIF